MNWPSPLALACLALLASACGPDALPRFANPPDVDVDVDAGRGVDADASDVHGGDDAGATDAEAAAPRAEPSGRRIT